MDKIEAEIVNYDRHGVCRPNCWRKPITRVYDVNHKTTNIIYQPMMRYIDNKELSHSYTGFENKPNVTTIQVLNRPRVLLPSADELFQLSQEPSEESGALRLGNFMVKARAIQAKQRNKQSVHVRNQRARNCKEAETLRWPRSSTSVRDKYIEQLSTMYATGTGKCILDSEETSHNGPWSRLN